MNLTKNLPYIGLAVFIPLICFFSWYIKDFKVDASASTLLAEANEKYIKSQMIGEKFGSSEFILVAFQPKSDRSIFSKDALESIEAISNRIKKIDRVKSVNSIVNAPIFLGADSFDTGTKFSELSWEHQRYSENFLSQTLKSHPIYEDLLVSKDQKSLSMQIVFKDNKKIAALDDNILQIKKNYLDGGLTEDQKNKLEKLSHQRQLLGDELAKTRQNEIDQIRAILKKWEAKGSFYLGGNNLLSYQLIKIIKNDLFVFGLAILVLVSLSLFYLFGSWLWVFLSIVSCAVCIAITTGLLGFLGIRVTVISANIVTLQIILSLALIIHLIEKYRVESEKDKKDDKGELIKFVIKAKVKPCFYAGLTTSIGFASLIFSGVQPVISFGWMMVLAMAVTIVICLLFFPITMLIFKEYLTVPKKRKYFKSLLTLSARAVNAAPKWIIGACVAVSVAGVGGCFLLTAENSFLNYFSDSTQVYKELSFIDKHFGGTTPLDIIYTVPPENRKRDLLLTADSIQLLEDLTEKLEKHKAMGNITSVADFTKVAHVVRGRPFSEAELTAVLDFLGKDVKQQFLLSYFAPQDHQLRVSTRVQDSTEGLDREQFLKDIRKDLEDLGVKKEDYQLSNLFVLYQDILSRLVRSQFTTLGLVYLAMFIVLLVIFRSFKVALIGLAPNFMTNSIVMGLMGVLGIPLDLMTMTIASVAMGMSMDDTIHYIYQFLEDKDCDDPVLEANMSVGYALIYSSLIVTVGFGSMIFSDFIPSVYFGILTGVAMIAALFADLTITPALLSVAFRKDKS